MSPAINDTQRVYLDLEYCYPGMTRESGRPSSEELRQVVQIAAIIFDHKDGREIASFDKIVVPAFTKELPDFFTELTDIDQATVDKRGIPFLEAMDGFKTFASKHPIYTFDKDWEVLGQNYGYYNVEFPFATFPFVRVCALFPDWGIADGRYSSGTLYQAAGIEMDGWVHNALHDVRSMAAAVHYFSFARA